MARQKPSQKPKTAAQKYNEKVSRIRSRIRAAEKRGFTFDQKRIESILKKPQKVTGGSLRKLNKLSRENLYNYSKYAGPLSASDKPVSGTKGRQFERKAAAAKAAETRKQKDRVNRDPGFFADNVINQFKDNIRSSYTSDKGRQVQDVLFSWLDGIINKYGKYDTAVMLNDGAADGVIFTPDVAYTEEKRNQYMADMLNYLPGGDDPDRRQAITEALEVDEEGFIIPGDMGGVFS